MLLMLVLAAVSQPSAQTGGLPSTPACDARKQAAHDQHAISRLRFGKSPHPVSSSVSEYIKLSDELAEAMRAPKPDLALIRSMSRDLAHRRVSIEANDALTETECHLDMVERSLPANRKFAISLITPPTKAQREAALRAPPPGPFIGDPPKTPVCDAMRHAAHDRWALSADRDAPPASSSLSEYLNLRDRLADVMREPNPDFALIRTMKRDLAQRRQLIETSAAVADADCDVDRIAGLQASEQRSQLLRFAPPTKAERENPKVAPPPGPYIAGSRPEASHQTKERSSPVGPAPVQTAREAEQRGETAAKPSPPAAPWFVSTVDYPAVALRNSWEGDVIAEFTITNLGRVSSCRAIQSSGHAVLDARSCEVLQMRGRFSPATDVSGKPVESSGRVLLKWRVE